MKAIFLSNNKIFDYEVIIVGAGIAGISAAKILDKNRIQVRVWERGTGMTLASGSSSCAVAVAAIRNELTQNKVTVDLDGGSVEVNWKSDGVWLTGSTSHSFNGILTKDFLQHE